MTMAITLQCPRCTHEQLIDDDRAGSEVPCKICHHLIQPSVPKPKPKLAPKSKPESSEGIQKGAPPVQPGKAAPGKAKSGANDGIQKGTSAGKPPPVAKTKPAKSRKEDDDDDDDDRPSPRSRSKSDSGSMPYVLLFGGGFLLLAFLCGGGGLGAYFLSGGNEPVAVIDPIPNPPIVNPPIVNPPIVNPPIEFPNPPPIGMPNPPPIFNPVPNPPIVAPKPLDPNNPADVDRVLTVLRGPAQERGQALNWLNNANVNHPRRADVAKQLDGMVDEALRQPFGDEPFFTAYFKWATKESTPVLIRIVDNAPQGYHGARNRHGAMKVLAANKEARAVDVIVKRLSDHGDRQAATDALIGIGAAAEPAVLKWFNHQDHFTRDAARRILQANKTGLETLVTQCIADLDTGDANRQREALQWLMKNPVEPKRKTEISKVLNKMLDADNALGNRDLVGALEAWGTSENTAAVVKQLDKTPFHKREAIRILGKIGDVKTAGAIARHLRFGFTEPRVALKEMGSAAEPAVIEVLNTTTDTFSRMECVNCLGDIGTLKLSVPALRAMEARLPQDFGFRHHSAMAVKQILARGK
jgi:hypothetical protein